MTAFELGTILVAISAGAAVLFGIAMMFAMVSAADRSAGQRHAKDAAHPGAAPKSGHGDRERFPLRDCLWGPLSVVAGGLLYAAVSRSLAGFPASIWAPPPELKLSQLPDLVTTVGHALLAAGIGVAVAATLAFFAAMIGIARTGRSVPGVAWVPVLAAGAPYLSLVFGFGLAAHVGFAAAAVALAGVPYFARANDEAAAAPAAVGRIVCFVLEAFYASFLVGLAAVIVMEFTGSLEGIGFVIMKASVVFDVGTTLSDIALVWLAVALLSFIVRCLQSVIWQRGTAADRTLG